MKQLNAAETDWIESWTIEEALAIYEFCTLMQDHLWRLHEVDITERFFDTERNPFEDPRFESNLELPSVDKLL